MRKDIYLALLALALVLFTAATWAQTSKSAAVKEELQTSTGEAGQYGGRLVVSQRAEAKTLNAVTGIDQRLSREVIFRMHADLIHINRVTQRTEPALAKSWTVSKDGRQYTIHLRRGIRFSDGQPFNADDVVFSFQVYLDEKVHSPQRDLLIARGQSITVQKLDPYTVLFKLAQPDAAAERLFDSVDILPKHLLEKSYQDGTLAQAWSLTTPPDQIAGLGPFRFKKYVPGQQITLERNPYYWKVDAKDNRLPYLDEITFLVVASEDAEAIRFQTGDIDVISRLSSENYALLAKDQESRGYRLQDLGPGLEYNFILFNLNDDTAGRLPDIARKQTWFREVKFRQAVSAAIDRTGIVRLVYQGRGEPLWAQVTAGNKLSLNSSIPKPAQSLSRARELLQSAGFTWNKDGKLQDHNGQVVEFSIISSSSNSQRMQIANIVQQDLAKLGMQVSVVPLEFRSFVQRVTQTHDYEAAVMGLLSGDVDPNADMNVWLSSGATHLWNLGEKQPATPWEAEIDKLMEQQAVTLNYEARKKLYDRVQEIVAEQLPIICVAGPNILVGSKKRLGNFRPAVLDHYTLHNVEELFWKGK
ncbi:MAG TPA: ABC transporter substrate-binding protein [Terriglobales bacterium]|nr:ABC transporter substrate-binding protein [Terriglobales bacterium]